MGNAGANDADAELGCPHCSIRGAIGVDPGERGRGAREEQHGAAVLRTKERTDRRLEAAKPNGPPDEGGGMIRVGDAV